MALDQLLTIIHFDHKTPQKMHFFAGAIIWYCNQSRCWQYARFSQFLLSPVLESGPKSVALGGDSACNQGAGRSHSFGLNPPPSASALAWKDIARLGMVGHCRSKVLSPRMGPFAPPPLLVLLAPSLFPVVGLCDWQERALSEDHSHPILGRECDQNTKHVFLSPTSFRWPPTWMSNILV